MVAVALGFALDRPLLMIVYGVVNVLGTLLFVEGTDLRRPLGFVVKVLAVLQVPVGLLGLVAISTSAMPTDHAPVDSIAHGRDLPRNRDDSSFRFGGPRDDRRS